MFVAVLCKFPLVPQICAPLRSVWDNKVRGCYWIPRKPAFHLPRLPKPTCCPDSSEGEGWGERRKRRGEEREERKETGGGEKIEEEGRITSLPHYPSPTARQQGSNHGNSIVSQEGCGGGGALLLWLLHLLAPRRCWCTGRDEVQLQCPTPAVKVDVIGVLSLLVMALLSVTCHHWLTNWHTDFPIHISTTINPCQYGHSFILSC